MRHSKRLVTFFVPVFFLLFGMAIFTGCSDDDEKIVEVFVHDTLYVEVEIMPITPGVTPSNENVPVGNTLTLTANATTNVEGVGELTYHWFATSGTFEAGNEGQEVTWKAPDEPMVATVSVHVTDGTYIGIGGMPIGVEMYVPTATPYYVGDTACAQCHSGTHGEWSETGHAHAWAGLMESDHAASYCFACHSVGYEGEEGNSGYDEAPILQFVNVQCENCHGPGSAHASGPNSDNISRVIDAETCGTCHEGEHHPYYTEWLESPHGFDVVESAHGAALRTSCEGCHEGNAAIIRLNEASPDFYGSGEIIADRDTLEYPYTNVSCAVCHNSHSAENPGQVRAVGNVQLVEANGEAPIITAGGTGKLCMQCHHARRGPESQIENGSGHFGPHHSGQADFMAGKTGFMGVAPPDFPWAGPSHLFVQNSCKTCHLNMIEYVSDDEPAVTGHTFHPTVEACANCHGQIDDFTDILALEDFDGDGSVEGLQDEVHGLLEVLAEAMVDAGLDTTGGVEIVDAIGDLERSTTIIREAGWNYAIVEQDLSFGIHNPDYSIQLLQQSYTHLTGGDVPNAMILREDIAVSNFAQ